MVLGRVESVTLWSGGGAKKQREFWKRHSAHVCSFPSGQVDLNKELKKNACFVEYGLQGILYLSTIKINKQNSRLYAECFIFIFLQSLTAMPQLCNKCGNASCRSSLLIVTVYYEMTDVGYCIISCNE